MSQVVRDANVYFLPATPAITLTTPARPSLWHRLRARCRADLWRLRFACAGFRLALRQPPHVPLFTDDSIPALAEQRAELIERRPRLVPARIIDLGSARARLRPLAASN